MHISRLQFKAEGPNFNAELIPVHSPLLRESCLVSYPPLTYMLKFSGFADLTSCQGNGRRGPREQTISSNAKSTTQSARLTSWLPPEAKCAERIKGSHETRSTLVRRHEQPTERGRPRPGGQGTTRRQHETEVDTEAGMLSGVSRKRSIRSSPCWFTEFCKSQCLSHFAAPFIVV